MDIIVNGKQIQPKIYNFPFCNFSMFRDAQQEVFDSKAYLDFTHVDYIYLSRLWYCRPVEYQTKKQIVIVRPYL